MTFDTLPLHPLLQKAIKACGFTQPTPIQATAIPQIIAGKDLMATAQTGTGKTAAFMLPALQRIISHKSQKHRSKPRILILAPTRELADQITAAANQYGKFVQFSITSLIGGMPYRRQLKALSNPIDIVVATPGRLMDHIENKNIDLSALELLVLDEADRMLDMGFIDEVKKIVRLTPNNRQTLLFSATLNNEITTLAKNILKNPDQIRIKPKQEEKAIIEQHCYLARNPADKSNMLTELLAGNNIFKAIIFSATRSYTDKLARQLQQQGYLASGLHGDLKQNQRNAIIEKMRNNKIQYLVATDVAARGIDIADITHVINYDFPRCAEDYVHRIGRTGRAGKSGIAISMVLPSETKQLKQVERFTGQSLQIINQKDAAPRHTPRPRHNSNNNHKRNNKRFYAKTAEAA